MKTPNRAVNPRSLGVFNFQHRMKEWFENKKNEFEGLPEE